MPKRIRRTLAQRVEDLNKKNDQRKTLEDISLELAYGSGLHQKVMRELLASFLNNIERSLHQGKSVMLSGFGTFRPKSRGARKVRNPRIAKGPGASKQVEASTAYKFKAGANLKPHSEEVELEVIVPPLLG